MVINAEEQCIMSPLLTRLTHTDNETVDIELSKSNLNHVKSISSVNTSTNNRTYVTSLNEHVFKTTALSFDKINYTIDQVKNIKKYHNWKQIFSCSQQTTTRQILFDLSGIFTSGMNAILGRSYSSRYLQPIVEL